MIKKISINNQATIKNLEFEPQQVNYFFGGNGTGKTTISKFLGNSSNYTSGNVVNDSDAEILVYNKDFVDSNFRDKNAINGIFTIGESAVEAASFIEEKEKERREFERELSNYQKSIDKIQGEIDGLTSDYEKNCWLIEQQIGASFAKALVGYRKSAKIFAQQCKESFTGKFFECELESLNATYAQIYQGEVQEYPLLKKLAIDLNSMEENELLALKIVQGTESNFFKFIEKLGNLDWISQGMKFMEDTKICPFCQQKIPNSNIAELETLFGETYKEAISELTAINIAYKTKCETIDFFFNDLFDHISSTPFISTEKISQLRGKFMTIVAQNQAAIANKINTPATSYVLEKTCDVVAEINDEIDKINKTIEENNRLAKNIADARKDFIATLWNYISNNRLYFVTEQFVKTVAGKNSGMHKLLGYRQKKEDEINLCNSEIKEKRSNIVCIDNAVAEINELLAGFGYNGFKIEKKDDVSYRLIRPDGSDVKETLSEGEHRFITFLYFYQLVKGTLDKDSLNKNKILIIDDPISSLDSNILFIVSYLVRDLIKKCLIGSNIEQIFVLTHNIYFHQEICFKEGRNNIKETKERFWILRKINEETIIESHKENQIKSSYELLWQEFKRTDSDGAIICNAMRRILEHYFNIIGHTDYSNLIDSFDGQDKLICKTLLPYINTGSHIIPDDFHMSIDGDMVDQYKRIFKKIFEKTHQIDHYNMMIGYDSK